MIKRQEVFEKARSWIGKGFAVVAPVRSGDQVLLKRIGDAESIELDHILTTNTVKDFLMPRSERLLSFEKGRIVDSAQAKPEFTIIFGIRPCDAAALSIIDRILLPTDQRYGLRRENSLVVTVACSSCDEACFCTSMGYGPHDSTGSDILLLPSQGSLLVKIVSQKGKTLADQLGFESQEIEDVDCPPQLSRKVNLDGIKQVLDRSFDSDVWKYVSMNCISCGACYYMCPTCHCFDLVDQSGLSRGIRTRIWDCCSFDCFTRMASHQPRRGKHARYRQRIMHKFSYTVDNIGMTACVGDGRCIRVCPVGVDLTEVLARIGEM